MNLPRHHRWLTLIPLFALLISALVSSLRVPVALAAEPTSVTLAGNLGHLISPCNDWQENCVAAHLTNIGNGVWRAVFPISAGDWEYKMVINDNWSESYAGNHQNGGNTTLHLAAASSVRFYFDSKTHAVLDSVMDKVAVAAGSFQGQLGCPGDWQPDCVRSLLTDVDGDGTYTFETTTIPPGAYEFKIALNETWDTSYPGNNVPFTVSVSGQKARITWNSSTNAVAVAAGHGHDNNVEYDGLAHDSRDSLYRVPFGAVTPNTPVTLRLRTFHNDATGVLIRLYDTAIGHEDKQPMTLAASNVDCYDAALTAGGNTCDFWQYTYTPSALGTVYYRFIITDGTATAYYSDNDPRYGGLGKPSSTEVDNGFRLNVVAANFPIVPWMRDGVMYQIFPDRFRNGDPTNDPSPNDPRYAYPAPAGATPAQIQAAADQRILNKKWTDLPEGFCRAYSAPATACSEAPQGRDYFGGDIKGVLDKLDYLRSVGVTIIYFNPIFESGSNHGYDTRDYLKISRYFGTNNDFKKLTSEAGKRGIKIVLDGVFNHLSSDSPFFDRYHHYTSVGACESTSSQFRSWFNFHDVALGTGTCADSQNRPNSATYDGWANFDSIPVIVKRDPTDSTKPYAPVAQYFYKNPNTSVAGFWLKQGAAGWRFDVMTDGSFPESYWRELRTITKGIAPNETLIAEAWHWYDNLPLTHGDQADTAMGYRFRNAVLGLLGAVDDKGFDEEGNPNLPPSTFRKRMESIREDYADATYYTFQNILDSHDTKRVLWSMTPGAENREDKELNAANLAKGKAREQIAALVQMTVPGTPTIYYGDELSVTGADDPDDRRAFPWKTDASGKYINSFDPFYFNAAGDHATLDWYRKLALIRVLAPVLREGKQTFLLANDTQNTLAYALRKSDSLAIVAINRDESNTRTFDIPTATYLRDGVKLLDALSGRLYTSTGGKINISLGALKGAILVMLPGQDITGPAAPSSLAATANNGLTSSVSLSWAAKAGTSSYNIYRSVVQGGGYVKVGSTTGTSFSDTNVRNGTTYYYIVRGVDTPGNEGANSNEANATPAFPIGYAVLQYPKTINQAITSNYVTIYGQVYIAGLTDAGGDPSAVRAQVGFGATGSNPATWVWNPMTYNAGHTGDNNYEYQGQLRADAPGSYIYLVRFSDDGGRSWAYGDQDGYSPGGSPGTNQPGTLTVTASADTSAPGAPVASIDFSSSSLTVKWSAVAAPDVAEYRIYRGTTPGGESTTPIAIVATGTLSYVDSTVGAGQTYYYTVKAYDTSLNGSPASNEVLHKVEAKVIQVTFRVKVPAFTPAGDTIYITGQSPAVSPDPLCGYCGGNAATAMHETAPGSHIWEITLGIPDGTQINYKYTRGTYDFVEEWGTIAGFTNRVNSLVRPNSPTDLTQLFDDTSDTIADDNHKAVQNWRDALVTSTTPANSAIGGAPSSIVIRFNWDVKSDGVGTNFPGAITVTSAGAAVAGTITHDAASQSLTFTPSAALAAGSYSVTVDHVVSLTQAQDGIKIRTPYTFTLTVN